MGPLPASAVTLARENDGLKNLPLVTLKPGSWKIKKCPIVLQSPNPSCFHKLLDNIGGGGRETKNSGETAD